MSEALGLEDAQARLLALAPLLPLESVAVADALGRFLGEDLRAARTQPAADLSAMDGYSTGAGEGPWRLVGESRAGVPFAGRLGAQECVGISTGAHLPEGAARILIKEDALSEGDMIAAAELPPPGRHIRPRGFDFCAGNLVLARGTRMTPGRIALALAAGHGAVAVPRRARVAVLDSGDELSADPANCAPHQIPASNGAMIAAMLAPLGCAVTRIGPVPDDHAALAAALASAADADVVITSGGASVGDHDLIKPALAERGAQIAFWKVAIKPGKPLLVATSGEQVVLGLPGNPASSYVTAFLFALPLLRAAMGDPDPLPRPEPGIAGEALPPVGNRREFLRAVHDGAALRLAGSQVSSALLALAAADCLIDRPAHAPALAAGGRVQVFNLRNG